MTPLKSWKEESLGGRIKILVFSLLPTIVLLIVGEYLSGLAIHREFATTTDAAGRDVYTMTIGRFPWSKTSRTPLNSHGLPDQEFEVLPEVGGCVRVILLGDSFVFGDGVDLEDSFVERLRSWSDARAQTCVRFFNLGQRGTTLERQSDKLWELLDTLKPDVVILGQYQNDLTDLTKHEREAEERRNEGWTDVRRRFRVFDSDIIRFLTYHLFASFIMLDIEYDTLDKWSVFEIPGGEAEAENLTGIYTQMYGHFVAELEAHGIEFGAMIFPSKFDVMAGRSPEEAYFVELAESVGAPYIRLFPSLDGHRRPYPYLMYDGHLNELGNQVVADALVEWLYLSEPAPFPALRAASANLGPSPPEATAGVSSR